MKVSASLGIKEQEMKVFLLFGSGLDLTNPLSAADSAAVAYWKSGKGAERRPGL